MTRLLLVAAALVAVLAAAGVGTGAEWDVYPGAGTPIQTAINVAGAGDTIYVHAGTYVENVDVNKRVTLIGDGADVVTVWAASIYDDYVFEVTADYANISGFTVGEGTGSGMIYLDSADHCEISNNVIFLNSTWRYGIYLYSSSNNNITNNNTLDGVYRLYSSNSCNNAITNNNNVSIGLFESFNNTLTNNNAISIWISCSSNNTLNNNKMHSFGMDIPYPYNITEFINFVDTSNKVQGKPIYYWIYKKDKEVPSDAGYVALVNCTNVTVEDATITGNGQGIVLAYTENSKIENVNASNNWDFGIGLYYSSNNEILNSNTSNEGGGYGGIFIHNSAYNTVTNNIASSNDRGIYIDYSSNNTLTNNTVNSNNRYGIYMLYSEASPNK